jgi:hypothetical protein
LENLIDSEDINKSSQYYSAHRLWKVYKIRVFVK